MNTSSGDSLQTYFEQQNDKEAASIVAAVIALLPSSWEQFVVEEEMEQKDNHHIYTNADNVLNQQNILLTKESEIAALKEVILKWRQRALEAEERLKSIQLNHEKECKLMESRYTRKLYQQEDIITTLNEQVDYLIIQQQKYRQQSDTESFASTIDYDNEEDEEYEESMMSSIYDRDVEQGLVTVQSRPTELKSETILDNIQDTMRAIEHELSFHTTSSTIDIISPPVRRHRRSPTYNSSSTYYSSATLIDSEASFKTTTTKKIKKSSSFFIHRIFKKAFPKLYKKNNTTMKYSTSPLFIDSSIQFDGIQQQQQQSMPVYPIQV